MRLLLDTHAFIWALADSFRLGSAATQAILDPGNECCVSAVSLWEISIKHSSGRLELKGGTPEVLFEVARREMGFSFVPLLPEVAVRLGDIPRLHGDPFDRMLIHQAIAGDYVLVSCDRLFCQYEEYGLKLLW